jgi:hypothetical protein
MRAARRVTSLVGDGYPSTGFKLLDIVLVYFMGGFLGVFLGFGKVPDEGDPKTK